MGEEDRKRARKRMGWENRIEREREREREGEKVDGRS